MNPCSSLPPLQLQGYRGSARSNNRTSYSSTVARRRVATSAAWLLLLGLSSSIGGTDAQSLACEFGAFIRYSDYADDFFTAIAPGYNFQPVRPCFIQPAKQPTKPPTNCPFFSFAFHHHHRTFSSCKHRPRHTARWTTLAESPFSLFDHFWLFLSTPSLPRSLARSPPPPLLCARDFSPFCVR